MIWQNSREKIWLSHYKIVSLGIQPDLIPAPVRRSADLQSAVKKCPNLFRLCGFAIRNIQFVLFGVVVGGLQIPRF